MTTGGFNFPKEGRGSAVVKLRSRGDGYSFAVGRYAIWQTHIPTALPLVHLQDHAGIAGRMVEGCAQQNKIRPQMFHGDGTAVDQQPHFYLSRVPALT